MGGLECTAEIRKLEAEQTTLRRIPIIAVTANARQGQMQQVRATRDAVNVQIKLILCLVHAQILDSGFDDAVAKPFSTKELTARITALAHAYRQTT
jgi:CheY-like chemotaxis protein